MIALKSLNKVHNLIFNQLLVMFTVDIVQSSVNGQNFDTFLPWNPFFVSLVYRLNVLQTDVFLAFSVANLDALKTYFR